MDTTKIITLTIIGIVSMVISLTVTQLLLRKEKSKSESEGKIRLAYGILFFTWVVVFSLLNFKSLSILNEYIDTIFKINGNNSLVDILKTSVIFIGLTNVWLILWHFITKVFTVLFAENRNEANEIENNHYTFFIMKGIVFVGFIYCLMPVFETILRIFLPTIQSPFYH